MTFQIAVIVVVVLNIFVVAAMVVCRRVVLGNWK